MNALTTAYWNSYMIFKYFAIQNIAILGIKTEAVALLKTL